MAITARQIQKLIEDRYGNYLEPLSILSKDKAHDESMIDSQDKFINYDRLGESLFPGKDKPKTPDMIFFKDGVIYFVEFKNGRIEGIRKRCEVRGEEDECQHVKWDIKLKALEGAFIVLHRFISRNKDRISFSEIFHLKKCYLLVYNKYKNEEKALKTRGSLKIGNHLAANRIRFGLRSYKDTFFSDVATFSPEVFEKKLREFKLIKDSPP